MQETVKIANSNFVPTKLNLLNQLRPTVSGMHKDKVKVTLHSKQKQKSSPVRLSTWRKSGVYSKAKP